MKKRIIVKFLVSILLVSSTFSVSISAKEVKNAENNNVVHGCKDSYDPHPIDVDLPE